jgi:hypothetical protein
MTKRSIAVILGLVVSIAAGIFAYNYTNIKPPKNIEVTVTPTPTIDVTATPTIQNNIFSFSKVKDADTVGEMTAKSIKKEEGYTTVSFEGKVEISGDYVSDYSGMSGQYITLNLDKESQAKIPYEQGQTSFDVVLDPLYQNNKALLKAFGETGTRGKFKIEIDNYYVTNWIESIQRVARISRVIEVIPEK